MAAKRQRISKNLRTSAVQADHVETTNDEANDSFEEGNGQQLVSTPKKLLWPVIDAYNTRNATPDLDPISINPICDLQIFVSEQIKEKSWDNKYFDLSLLMKSNFNSRDEQEPTLENNTVKINAKQKKNQILDLNQWTDAFLNFVQIYIIKHPEKAGQF